MKENYQPSHPQRSPPGLKRQNTQSFGSDKAASILYQFKQKTREVLNDDLKMRKLHQSFIKPVQQPYKHEIREFLKQFKTKPKDQFIQLCNFLIDKYVDFVNLKIYIWYFREAKDIGSWKEALPFCGLLDSFSQSVLIEQSEKCLNKSMKSEETCSKQPSSFHNEQSDPLQDFYISPIKSIKSVKLQKMQSLPEVFETKSIDGQKFSKDIFGPLQKLFQNLSAGNFDQVSKQKLPEILEIKLKKKIQRFSSQCQVIKKVVQYFNSSVLSSDRVKPEPRLSSLQKCMQKISKNKSITKSTTSQESCNRSEASIQDLELALSKTQQLFNKKSSQFVLEKRKYTCEMDMRIKEVEEENSLLSDEIRLIKEKFDAKERQIIEVKNSLFKDLQIKNKVFQCQNQTLSQQIIQKQQRIVELEGLLKISEQKFSSESHEIFRLKQTICSQETKNQSLKNQIIEYQNEVSDLQKKLSKQTLLRMQFQQKKQKNQENQSKLELQKAKEIQRKINEKQNYFLRLENSQLTISLQKLEESNQLAKQNLQKLQKKEKNNILVTEKLVQCLHLNEYFQSSRILIPYSFQPVKNSLLAKLKDLSETSNPTTNQLLQSLSFHTLLQKNFLCSQIEKYSRQCGTSNKIKLFRLVYRFDQNLKTNFHEYIDQTPNFLVLVKLKTGAVIGGYSHQPLRKGTRTELGFLFSLNLMQTYRLKEKYCLVYDEYYLIFGNSQIRIKTGENTFYSNFGISKAHFQTKERKFTQFLMAPSEREQQIQFFEIFQVIYDQQ